MKPRLPGLVPVSRMAGSWKTWFWDSLDLTWIAEIALRQKKSGGVVAPPVRAVLQGLLQFEADHLNRTIRAGPQFLFNLGWLQLITGRATRALDTCQKVAVAVFVEDQYGFGSWGQRLGRLRNDIGSSFGVAITNRQGAFREPFSPDDTVTGGDCFVSGHEGKRHIGLDALFET